MKKNLKFKITLCVFCLMLFFGVRVASAGTMSKPSNFLSVNSGLVGWWTMDGQDINWATNQMTDKSGNNNTGALISMSTSTSPVVGKVGQALKFDGVNDYVTSIPYASFENLTVFTISTWVKLSGGTSGNPVILSQRASNVGSLGLQIYSDNKIYAYINNGANVGSNVLTWTNGQWYHVVASWNGTTVTYYRDGASVGTDTFGSTTGTKGTNFTIGAWDNTTAFVNFFPGLIDDVRVYNRALSATTIQQLYNQGSGAKIASSRRVGPTACTSGLSCGLVGYWTFDGNDMSNGKALDKSGNNNSGNLINIATSTFYTQGKIGQGFKFDGVNDYVVATNSTSITSTQTSVSAWVKFNSFASGMENPRIVEVRDGTNSIQVIRDSGSGKFVTKHSQFQSGVTGTQWSTPSVGVWYHIVTVFDSVGNTTNFYVNGVADSGSANNNIGTGDQANKIYIGIRGDLVGTSYLNGTLDDVRVYNRALSASEITQIYNQGSGAKVASSQRVGPTTCASGLSCGLVGYWTFDGNDMSNGVALDKSGNNNSGNLINIATSTFYTRGKIGQGFKFDGVNDVVSMAANSNYAFGTGNFTISQWVYVAEQADVPAYAGLVSQYVTTGSWFTELNNDASNVLYRYGFYNGTSHVDSEVTIIYGQWVHFVVVREGTGTDETKMYINNLLARSFTTATDFSATNKLWFGNINFDDYPTAYRFKGKLDDVRVYNRALSAGEVGQLYNIGR